MKKMKVSIHLIAMVLLVLGISSLAGAQDSPLSKVLNSGDDPVGLGKDASTTYVYTININANFDTTLNVRDVVPAEFDVISLAQSCGTAFSTEDNGIGKGNPFKLQPDFITWDLEACDNTTSQSLTVTIVTDKNPGHAKRGIAYYEPTECGPLSLNDGAFLIGPEIEEPGLVSNSLSVATCPDENDDLACSDADDDGWSAGCNDCEDENAAINPGVVDVCDGIDNDCDGTIDEGVPEICDDGLDNDCDTFSDAADPDCVI